MRSSLLLIIALAALPLAGCGDTMSRGLVITGDGKVGANNAKNQRENCQDVLRTAIEEDLGEGWAIAVAVKELPQWIEDRGTDDGVWRWERITATIDIAPPAGVQMAAAKHDELERDSRAFLMRKLFKKDAALVDLTLRVGPRAAPATVVVAAPAAPVAQTQAQRTYVVQPGDTLADISLAFYGSTQHWRRIADANPGGTEAGKTIVIPAAAAPAPAAP